MKYVLAGGLDFIGNFIAENSCEQSHEIVGLINLNEYHKQDLRLVRLKRIQNVIPLKCQNSDNKNTESNDGSLLYKIYSIGNNQSLALEVFVNSIKNFMPMHDNDVVRTFANTRLLEEKINFYPKNDLQYNINKFVDWYDTWSG